jgi:hypothetical protein
LLYLLFCCGQSKAAENLRLNLKNANLEDGKKRELTQTIHAHFRDWLLGTSTNPYYFLFGFLSGQAIGTDCGSVSCAASGNIRQMYDLHTLDQEAKAIE